MDARHIGPAIRIVQLNIEGISRAKSDYLSKLLIELEAEVAVIQETHVESLNDLYSRGKVAGYEIIAAENSRVHGIVTYVKNGIQNVDIVESRSNDGLYACTIRSSRPTRSTRGIPTARYGLPQMFFPLNRGGLPRSPINNNSEPTQCRSNYHNQDDDNVSEKSHHSIRSHLSTRSVASHSSLQLASGNARTERVLQRAASERSISKQNSQDFESASNKLKAIEVIYKQKQQQAQEEAEKMRQEVLESVGIRSELGSTEFQECQSFPKSYYSQVSKIDDTPRSISSRTNNWVQNNPTYEPFNANPNGFVNLPRENTFYAEPFNANPNGFVNLPRENTFYPEFNSRDKLLSDAFKALTTNKQVKNLPEFSGSIKEWPIFISEFERSTKEYNISDAENLRRLNIGMEKRMDNF
uniref:CSON000885 protein n=1 Tax=Culicoides sonorensis TaxID=179676 RepID=A0A336MJJ3_CULSO